MMPADKPDSLAVRGGYTVREAMTRDGATSDYTAGLRELADWYDAHPDVPVQQEAIRIGGCTRADLSGVARALGHAEKQVGGDGSLLVLSRHFGPIELRFLFDRAAVCTRRVVGTRIVPAQPASEAEVVEWDCPESLLAK